MTDPKPYYVARWISVELRDAAFRPLRSVIEEVIARRLVACSVEEIAERSEALADSVFVQLGIVAEQDADRGVERTFELDGDSGDAYIRAANTEAAQILERLRALTPRGFEQFCARLLTTLGGKGETVGRVRDGGVDFLALEFPCGRSDGPAFRRASSVVVGQAKRYQEDNLVSELEVREFLGGALVRADDIRRDNGLGLMSPVVFAFWTTSELNANAVTFARRSGIWYLGGLALAQLASRSGLTIDGSD
jgi:restriction endonuclease Mrr